MATSKDLNGLAKRIVLRADQLTEGVEKLVRKSFLIADTVAVLGTPVDTGRARGNWIASIGSPQRGIKNPDKSGRATIALAQTVAKGYRVGGNGIFSTNNVAYILKLENGSSKQAPNGMAKLAIQAATAFVKRQKVLK